MWRARRPADGAATEGPAADDRDLRGRPVPGKLRAFALYAALTLVLMYPMSVRPASVVPGEGPDTHLGLWMLAWDVHAFTHQPLAIFDANIFYPQKRTLAYQDSLIGSALLAAPVLWLTGNPVLALNFLSLLACALCGLGAYILARRLGLSEPAALICGLIFAFCPARFYRYSQIGLAPVQWIPLSLASLHAYLDGGGRRHLWLAIGFFTLQTLTSGHTGLFLVVAILTVLVYRFALGEPVALRKRLADLGVPGVLLFLPAILIYLPYRTNQLELGLRRTLGGWFNTPESFLASPTHFHRFVLSALGLSGVNERAYGYLFIGYLPILLALVAAVGLIVGRRRADPATPRRPLLVPVLQLLLVAALGRVVFVSWRVMPGAAPTNAHILSNLVWPWVACGVIAAALLLTLRVQRRTEPAMARRPLTALAVAVAILATLASVRPSLQAGDGLTASYFTNTQWTGYPAMSAVDGPPSTAVLIDRWAGAVPQTFSVRWTGYLTVREEGEYRFATTSDDGSSLSIDQRTVVNNEGAHVALTQTGSVRLSAGSHLVVLDYVQYGGPFALDWSWERSPGTFTPLPGWMLSQRRTRYATAVAARALDWAAWVCIGAAAASAVWWLFAGGPALRRYWAERTENARLNPLPLYVLLTLLCVGLALGPPISLWPYVYWMPGFSFIRAPLRFMVLGALGVAVLAAMGFDRLAARLSPRNRRAALVGAAAFMIVEFVGIPILVVPYVFSIPAADHWLDTRPKPFVVAEVPVEATYERHQTTYMLHSMAHWQKTVAGYGGIRPRSHHILNGELQSFPDERSLVRLTDMGVTYVVVHIDLYDPPKWPGVEQRLQGFEGTWLKREYTDPLARVYSLHRPPGTPAPK